MKKQAKKMTLTRETLSQLGRTADRSREGSPPWPTAAPAPASRLTRAVSGATVNRPASPAPEPAPPTTADLESRSEGERREILRRSPSPRRCTDRGVADSVKGAVAASLIVWDESLPPAVRRLADELLPLFYADLKCLARRERARSGGAASRAKRLAPRAASRRPARQPGRPASKRVALLHARHLASQARRHEGGTSRGRAGR